MNLDNDKALRSEQLKEYEASEPERTAARMARLGDTVSLLTFPQRISMFPLQADHLLSSLRSQPRRSSR